MSKLHMINHLKDILNEQVFGSLFKGVNDGMIHYGNSRYKLSHPISDLEVIDFNIKDGSFKVKGNFVVGTKEGVMKPHVLKHVVKELDNESETIVFPLGGNYGNITMTKI